jgi:hypothetical protein
VSEVAARHFADPSLTEIAVAFYLSDGTTARSSYPIPPEGTDPSEAVEELIRKKKRAGAGIAVDSMDSETGGALERFIAPAHIVAWVIS